MTQQQYIRLNASKSAAGSVFGNGKKICPACQCNKSKAVSGEFNMIFHTCSNGHKFAQHLEA
jgi:hypothetical protein